MPENCAGGYCTGKGVGVLLCLSGRTRSSGARSPAHDGASRLPRPCQQRYTGSTASSESHPDKTTETNWVKGHAKPLRPVRLFFGVFGVQTRESL